MEKSLHVDGQRQASRYSWVGGSVPQQTQLPFLLLFLIYLWMTCWQRPAEEFKN